MNAEVSPKEDQHGSDAVLGPVKALVVSLFLVYALIAVSSFFPRAQLWGINHLAFYSLPVRLIVLAVTGAVFLPFVARPVYKRLLALSRLIKSGGPRVDYALTIAAALSLIAFVLLTSSTNLLGDGQLIAQSFDAAWEGNDTVVMRNVKSIVTEEKIAPGATLYYYGAGKVASGLFNKGPVDGIRHFNCLLGAIALFILFSIARRGPFSPELRIWLLVLVMFSSSMELFYGYMENYTPLLFTGFLFVVSGFMILHSRWSIWAVLGLFLLSFYSHIQAFLFVPALVYLILWRAAGKRRHLVEHYVPALLMVLAAAGAFVAGAFTPLRQFYLPLRADGDSYGFFTSTHLIDIFNELLMLVPLLPSFFVLAWTGRSRNRDTSKRSSKRRKKRLKGSGAQQAPAVTGWFALRCEWHFVSLLLFPCLIYLLFFKPEIGMARDWDLFAMTALGLIPLALLFLNRFFRSLKTESESAVAVFVVPAVVITIVLGGAWIGINASPDRTTARFQNILEYDRTHASYAYENLSIFFYDRKNMPKALEMLEIATDISHNPRQYVRLGMYYDEMGRREEAIELMRSILKTRPEYDKARKLLVSLLEKDKLFAELADVAREGTVHEPKEAIYWFYLGEMSIRLGNIEEGVAAFRECLMLNPPEAAADRARQQIELHAPEEE